MRSIAFIAGALAVGMIGCSPATSLKQAPTSVSGKVSRAGQPVGDVLVSFHPLDQGHPCSFPVKSNGTFQGEIVSGNYAYFVGPSTTPNSAATLRKIDPKYLQADLGRSVAVLAGQELVVALD
jgi:hypothetical protein